jgi:RimJ/RimL family protein N-acetyltransferase
MDEFRTERLLWRSSVPDDLDDMHALFSDYEVVKWTSSWPYPSDRAFTASRCVPVDPDAGIVGPFMLDRRMVGCMGIVKGEMGFCIARSDWGKGFATEMGRAVVARFFRDYDADMLRASAWVGNDASARVLEKLGFAQVGTSRQACKAQGKDMESRDFALSRTDWLAANPLAIATERLLIRPYRDSDAVAFHAIASHVEVARMMISVPHPLNAKQAADWIAARHYQGRLGFCAGVFLHDGTLVGNVGIGGEPTTIMYFVDPARWGQGLATEALRGFLAWACAFRSAGG